MVKKMVVLHSTDTWDLVTLHAGKSLVGCRWVYTVKIGPNGGVNRLKACLVAKGYTQIYGSNYYDTFSLLYGCYEILAPISVGHQEYISLWRPRRGGMYGETTRICCSGEV